LWAVLEPRDAALPLPRPDDAPQRSSA